MIAKAVGWPILLGIAGIGGVAVTKPEWLDIMPGFHALSKDRDYQARLDIYYGNGKLGPKYRNYLVGVDNKKNDKERNNRSWWEWAYRRLKRDGISSGRFQVTKGENQRIEKAYSESAGDKALNQVCDAAYQSTDTPSIFPENNASGNQFNKSEVWKYCSPLGKEPSEVKTGDYSEGNIGGEKDAKFISTRDGANALFWFIRDKEIKGDDGFEKMRSSDDSKHFKRTDSTLRELCEEAYNSPKDKRGDNLGTLPTLNDTKKYCVFDVVSAVASSGPR